MEVRLVLTAETLRMLGYKLSLSETADLFVKSVKWDVVVETVDFEIIDGEDKDGNFVLIKGNLSGEGYILRD